MQEYMFLDNSACNLASLNLMRFVTPAGTFDIAAYRHAISVMITAMEILVDNSGYPTEAIARNSHDYRPLGLGYANLGALLMSFGLPYDSEAGRDLAASMTAIMCGPGVSAVGGDCRAVPAAGFGHAADRIGGAPGRSVPRLLRQPRAVPGRDPDAPRRGEQHRQVAAQPASRSPCRNSTR